MRGENTTTHLWGQLRCIGLTQIFLLKIGNEKLSIINLNPNPLGTDLHFAVVL